MELTQEQLEAKKQEIREGNDRLRKTFSQALGKIVVTSGVADHPLIYDIVSAVKEFYKFDASNDPHHEHDFGCVELVSTFGHDNTAREKFFFKIDYYDLNLEYGADPYSQPFKRVLTIMKSSEY